MKKGSVKRIIRWLLLIGVCLFAIAQFIRPAKTNPTSESSNALEAHVQVDLPVAQIFNRSCNDCHSNKTRWPWYSHVAPVSWFVIDHVNHGRSHMNFSEWGSYDKNEQRELLDETCRMVKKGEMPLSSYTPMHSDSKLTPADITTICEWTNRLISQLQ
ncbi:MAG TPA: heme-binding domain-containing protein [Pyrinomonadaceae bacterium]|nr:heme-binding domain-containing protein [Pyrinomonadaceae bacterium]